MLNMPIGNKGTMPDYLGLVKFLVTPFLESPETLRTDCEHFNNGQKVWLRLAFATEDRGKVYGRGGKNIQAIRTVLQISAINVGQSLSLEIYEEKSYQGKERDFSGEANGENFQRKPRSARRPTPSKQSLN